jgi:pimeloyl-ACP methyl ester carboxylesterase
MRSLLVGLLACLAAQNAWIDRSPHSEKFVTANGIRLHYLDWGGAGDEVMVFLTGMGVTPHIFDDLAPRFTKSARVIGLTRRGLGRSDKPESGYDTATLTEDVRGFLDALKVERATLIGWSLAGTEMTRFATLYPKRVRCLIYLDAAYDYTDFPQLWGEDPLSAAPRPEDLTTFEASRKWFTRTFGVWSDAIEADGRAVNLQPDGTMKLESMTESVTKQLMTGMTAARPAFEKVTVPVLAFFALSDTHPLQHTTSDAALRAKAEAHWKGRFLPRVRRQIDDLKQAIPTARIVTLPGAPHMCFIRPEDVKSIVAEIDAFRSRTFSPGY